MVAVAILGLLLSVILSAQGGLAASNRSAANMGMAADLGRCKMTEIEEKLLRDGYPEIDAIDSTAAGDTFCGALAAALSRRQTLAEALRLASAAGALACTRLGAQSSIPLQSEVNAFLQTQPAPNSQQLEALLQYCGLPRPTA